MRVSKLRRTARACGVVSIAAVVALISTACGSSSVSGAPPASSAEGGGTPAPPGPSIRIGFANLTTGTTSLPAVTQGAEAAAKYLNEMRGGIAGHRVELVTCDLKNDNAAAQLCGQQFANDTSMPFAMLAATTNGGPFYTAMAAARKPILGGIGITPADDNPQDTYFYYPGSTFNVEIAKYMINRHPNEVTAIYEEEPASVAGNTTITKAMNQAGIKFTSAGIPAATADLTPQVAGLNPRNSDIFYLSATSHCGDIAKALKNLGIKPKQVIAESGCILPSDVQKNSSLYEGWLVASPTALSIVGKGVEPDITQFIDGWAKYGPGTTPGTFAELGWGMVLTAANVIKTVPATPADANTVLKSYTGPVVMGPQKVSCPGPAPFTATCGAGLVYYTIHNGKYEPVTG